LESIPGLHKRLKIRALIWEKPQVLREKAPQLFKTQSVSFIFFFLDDLLDILDPDPSSQCNRKVNPNSRGFISFIISPVDLNLVVSPARTEYPLPKPEGGRRCRPHGLCQVTKPVFPITESIPCRLHVLIGTLSGVKEFLFINARGGHATFLTVRISQIHQFLGYLR
jgi:hypothetical protein